MQFVRCTFGNVFFLVVVPYDAQDVIASKSHSLSVKIFFALRMTCNQLIKVEHKNPDGNLFG